MAGVLNNFYTQFGGGGSLPDCKKCILLDFVSAVLLSIRSTPSSFLRHIAPFAKFHRIGGAPPGTFPNGMMPLKRWIAAKNGLSFLLGNEVWSKFLM